MNREYILFLVKELKTFKKINKHFIECDLWKYVPIVSNSRQQDLFDFVYPDRIEA
jgi:hypothetical protein